MLDLAAKYESELQMSFADAFMNPKNLFYFGGGYSDKYKASETTWNKHEFVSIKDGKVLGYLSYNINQRTNSADGMCAINFGAKNLTFSNDFMQFLKDIFDRFKFRKLSFGVYIGNPAEKMYDRYIKKFGGRIVGISKGSDRLTDGNYYDYKMYEIFRDDYLNHAV
ncbi:MAG TPA: GNAT family protein [Caproiciproducens sp.]|nr:GNAT family protein [Caproiciproducens sp.]